VGVLMIVGPAFAGTLADGRKAVEEQRYEDALTTFSGLAKAGNPAAKYWMGLLAFNGWGRPKDDDEAARWLRRSAEAGYPEGEFYWGRALLDGRGADRDPVAALAWFERAAMAGSAAAMNALGVMHEKGIGTPKKTIDAFVWFARAAKAGWPAAIERRDALSKLLSPSDVALGRALAGS
jgi:TPR repeat protein